MIIGVFMTVDRSTVGGFKWNDSSYIDFEHCTEVLVEKNLKNDTQSIGKIFKCYGIRIIMHIKC